MIVVIQCAKKKRDGAGFLLTDEGRRVSFVADPRAPSDGRYHYARPDDLSDRGVTWREVLLEYNRNPRNNPLGLYPAYQLYERGIYGELVERYGVEKTYILSIASSLLGQRRMGEIIRKFGEETIETFVDELIDYTERWSRQAISELPEGEYYSECYLDDDGITDEPIKLAVTARIEGGRVSYDLTGSAPQRSSPMNATLTQTYSPLAYVIKCLIDPNIPTNDGFYPGFPFWPSWHG